MSLAVGKEALKTAILALMGQPNDSATTKDQAAETLAQAIVDCIATATFTAGGTMVAGPYPVTGVQEGGVS